MSHYIRCDQCGCDSLDTDTLHCSCGSDAPTSCAAAERFSADLAALRERLAAAEKRAETAEALVRELATVIRTAHAKFACCASCVRYELAEAMGSLSPAARKEIEG